MQIEERCKTRIPGRPGEGAVRGFSGAAQRSQVQLEWWCSTANAPLSSNVDAIKTNGDLKFEGGT